MDLNKDIALRLIRGQSIRAIAQSVGLTYYNTYKKFLWMKRVTDYHKQFVKISAKSIQFDELETIEHTKCKPVNIVLVVDEKYRVLAAKVAEMPCKGRLAEFSRKKYGPRKNQRAEKVLEALNEVKSYSVSPIIEISSDAHPTYRGLVRQVFPNISYIQYSAREQKKKYQERMHENNHKKKYDPLFRVNHKSALLRYRINRLVRRSWSTTKKITNLQTVLDILILENLGVIHLLPKSSVKNWDFGEFG